MVRLARKHLDSAMVIVLDSWQQTKQSFLLLFKVAYLVEKHQILIIQSFDPIGKSKSWSAAMESSTITIALSRCFRAKRTINWTRKQKHSTICVGHHYTQTNTNNVNKTINLSWFWNIKLCPLIIIIALSVLSNMKFSWWFV
jgi:hypothetical protein